MVEADPVMRAARNGFGAMMVALLLLWTYQFTTTGSADRILFDLWLFGAVVYLLSQVYYKRQIPSGDSDRSEE